MMRTTKYGMQVSEECFIAILEKTKNKVWKLIPLREEGSNWEEYLSLVMDEISGFSCLLNDSEAELVLLLSKLETLKSSDFEHYRRRIFKCLREIDAIIDKEVV